MSEPSAWMSVVEGIVGLVGYVAVVRVVGERACTPPARLPNREGQRMLEELTRRRIRE